MIYTYQHENTTYTLNLEPQPDGSYRAHIGDHTYEFSVKHTADGGLLLNLNGQQKRIYSAKSGAERYIHINGQTLNLAVPETRSRRRSTASAGDGLTAQMPGQVVDVSCKAGDSVQKGQTLVILEAMKMEIRISAPVDGIIKRVHVQIGQTVERGQSLVEITSG